MKLTKIKTIHNKTVFINTDFIASVEYTGSGSGNENVYVLLSGINENYMLTKEEFETKILLQEKINNF